jgi:hypothetical protein
MRKLVLIPLVLALLMCGCASSVEPMGNNTYMVEHGGWPHMDEGAMEVDCLKDANRFCKKHELDLIQTSFTGRDGQVFVRDATCKLVFKAVPKGSQEDVQQNTGTKSINH